MSVLWKGPCILPGDMRYYRLVVKNCTPVPAEGGTNEQGRDNAMFCRTCGKELPDTAKFCNGCGTPVAPSESPAPPVSEPEIQNSPVIPDENAAPAGETVFGGEPTSPETPGEEPVPPIVPVVAEEGAPAPKRLGARGMMVKGAVAVAALVVVVLLFKLVSGMTGGGRAQAFVYLSRDNELMYLADLKEKTEALEISDDADMSARVQFSSDGKTIYFLDNRETLYKIAVADLKKDGRPERIARDVWYFVVLKTGDVLYTKEGGALYCYTGKEDFRLVKDYDQYQIGDDQISKDQKTLYYTQWDEGDSEFTLCKVALKKDARPEELLDGIAHLYSDYNADLLVYSESEQVDDWDWNSGEGRNPLTIYSCKPGGEPAQLVDEVQGVYGLKTEGGKVSFYYAVENRRDPESWASLADLYRYTGGKEPALVAEDVNLNYLTADWESGVLLYKKDLDPDSEWYQNVGGVESELDLDDESSVGRIYVLNGKEVVLTIYEDGDCTLLAYALGKNGLTFSSSIADGEISNITISEDSKSICFFTDVDYGYDSSNPLGDFTRYSGGKTEVIAREVYGAFILDDSGTIYLGTDYDRRGVELSVLKNDKPVVISDRVDDAGGLVFLDAKQLLYISDDDLYLWDGKESRRIARDVECVWTSVQESYVSYKPNW